jgi:hypothetical protein
MFRESLQKNITHMTGQPVTTKIENGIIPPRRLCCGHSDALFSNKPYMATTTCHNEK